MGGGEEILKMKVICLCMRMQNDIREMMCGLGRLVQMWELLRMLLWGLKKEVCEIRMGIGWVGGILKVLKENYVG